MQTILYRMDKQGPIVEHIKKAEHRRIDSFELWCWRRRLFERVPWTARGSNQSILKEISPECSLEGLRLMLKLQSFGHLTTTADSGKTQCWKRLKVEEESYRGRRGWMTSLIQWPWTLSKSGRWWWTGKPGVLQPMGLWRTVHDYDGTITIMITRLKITSCVLIICIPYLN